MERVKKRGWKLGSEKARWVVVVWDSPMKMKVDREVWKRRRVQEQKALIASLSCLFSVSFFLLCLKPTIRNVLQGRINTGRE